MSKMAHSKSLEFDLAESIWHSAVDKSSKQRAIDYYKLAAEKNDARAYLALFKINEEWANSYLLTGKQHNGIGYLNSALKLNYLPAFLYVGGLGSEFSVYDRLIYLSIGLNISYRSKDAILSELQKSFLNLSSCFASEFIPEILSIGEKYTVGNDFKWGKSSLDGRFIVKLNKYQPELDIERKEWQIFPAMDKLHHYLPMMKGFDDYQNANMAAESGDHELFETLMRSSARKGNGQAIYALISFKGYDLINAAQHGSPDGLQDLMDWISDFPADWDLIESLKSDSPLFQKANARFESLAYLYFIIQRLGIEKHCEAFASVVKLSSETNSGYVVETAPVSGVLFNVLDHSKIVEIKNRAYLWMLGGKFDEEFFKTIEDADLNYEKLLRSYK
jgi:hypothetical protein